MSGTIHVCSLTTRYFEFETFGKSASEAESVMFSAIKMHCKQYNTSTRCFLESYPPAEWTKREIEIGKGYRDGQKLMKPVNGGRNAC